MLLIALPVVLQEASWLGLENRDLTVHVGRDRWCFTSRLYMDNGDIEEDGDCVSITKNGRYLLEPTNTTHPWVVDGVFLRKFGRPRLRTRFPVVAQRGHSSCGHGQRTLFYWIRNGRLYVLGSAPGGEGGGPINWKGKQDYWLFDDYDYYDTLAAHPRPVRYHLFFADPKRNRLVPLAVWQAPNGRGLPDSVGITF